MTILSICDNSTVLSVLRIANIVIYILCIAVPILLILSVMISIVKEMLDGKNEMIGNILKNSVPKFIAAACIIFVPTFVRLTVDLAGSDSEYAKCLGQGTTEKIIIAKINEATTLVERAEKNITNYDYMAAKSAVNKLADGDSKDQLLERLALVKRYLDAIDVIILAEKERTMDAYEAALAVVEALPDGDTKTQLLERLAELRKSLGPQYPLDPADELYQGLRTLSGKTIKEVLEENGSSVEELEEEIKDSVEAMGVGTREASAAAAVTLIGRLATYGYKMNYYWGGKYGKIGVKPTWGKNIGSSPYCGSHPNPDYCKSSSIYSSFDCSGFVWWSIVNGMQDESYRQVQTSIKWGVDTHLKGQTEAVCQVGDALLNEGHITIVTGIDEENKRYYIAESSNGVTLSTKPFNDSSYWCRKLDDIYSN